MTEEDPSLAEDLEDGEIESDQEPQNENDTVRPVSQSACAVAENKPEKPKKDSEKSKRDGKSKRDESERRKAKEHKKSKEYREEKHRSSPVRVVDDDFAGNIEKAIRKELKKIAPNSGGNENDSGVDDSDSKKKHKKRKKHDHAEKEITPKKRRRNDSDEEVVDEDEMMCVRGASPVHKQFNSKEENINYSGEEYDSSYSNDSDKREFGRDRSHTRGFRGRGGSRNIRADRFKNKFEHRHRTDRHPLQDPEGICLFYMQGKCYKGDDCSYSHDAQPPRKMELCKFYLNDCCAKRDKCLYLHSDFPCKFYHTGIPCSGKEPCKFAHGKPLSEEFKNIILKHIESAPKEILGDFPRLSRENALLMLTNTQKRLEQQYSSKSDRSRKRSSSPKDVQKQYSNKIEDKSDDNSHESHPSTNDSSASERNRRNKARQSRWTDLSPANSNLNYNNTAVPGHPLGILNLQNLSGVLTQKQITELINLGINDITQLTSLTVIQMNLLGISFNQINEIQLNTMNIQKLGLIDSNAELNPKILINKVKSNQDLDMRVSPGLPQLPTLQNKPSDPVGGDIDMRFQANRSDLLAEKENSRSDSGPDCKKRKDILDIDQYTKDALKFTSLEKGMDNDFEGNENASQRATKQIKRDMDVDHRVLNYMRDAASVNLNEDFMNNECDTDIRVNMMQPKMPYHRKGEERTRRPTTDDEDDILHIDDEDNILHIDEKYYSSDEDQAKLKSKPTKTENEPKSITLHPTDTNTVIKNLGDLSKIDISEEVTKLLSTIKESTNNEKFSESKKEFIKSRDPRHLPKPVVENKEPNVDNSKKISHKHEFVSIYDCAEDSTESIQPKVDVDLRTGKDLDLRIPTFGDTDLRQTPGGSDVDLRLSLPIKLLPNYTPAVEIDGSFDSHAPITYKVYAIDIPRPDYTGIKNSTPKSQANNDPRLRKMFRLSIDEPPAASEPQTSKHQPQVQPTIAPRIDPRKRTIETAEKIVPTKPAPPEIPTIIQTSEWYKELGSKHKILVNQQLAMVTSKLRVFHQNKAPGSKFDLAEIKSNVFLCMILNHLGIFLDENGEFFLVNSQDNMPPNMQTMNFNPNLNPDMFMGNQPMDNMNMMMGMNNMGFMGPMNNFDPRFPAGDPRGAPGILGVPPNMNTNFDNVMNMPNYNDNYNNMNYDNFNNGPGNNGNDYMNDDMDDDYYRECKMDYKNNYRGGRNNDRWNRGRSRGGGGSGGRDRRGFTERSNWKNDRH